MIDLLDDVIHMALVDDSLFDEDFEDLLRIHGGWEKAEANNAPRAPVLCAHFSSNAKKKSAFQIRTSIFHRQNSVPASAPRAAPKTLSKEATIYERDDAGRRQPKFPSL
jgi:hypothetical protein